MNENFAKRLDAAVQAIRDKTPVKPILGVVTGTGLASLLDDIETEAVIPYAEIEGFPVSTAPTHKGELIFGSIGNTPVIAQNGRFHLYEGWQNEDIVLPVYVMAQLGVRSYVVTNAAGALNEHYRVADIMLIEDHLNFLGAYPLAGPNHDKLGPRFPDMSRAYDPDLASTALKIAENQNLNIRKGIYAGTHGPQFETSAERRFMKMAGGDAVGMSTIPEVIAANHAGLKVLGFSAITNQATGGEDQQPDSLEEVLENAELAAKGIRSIILKMINQGIFE